ncbi:MAG TPA: tRNA lysidine(34) synthetase TilS [Flavobacterium sp.]
MREKFLQHLQKHLPFLSGKKLLLAISGGIDSMVMLNLFHDSGFDIAAAHCNFKLRGDESDADQDFVAANCENNNIAFFTTNFDTKAFVSDYKLSVQVAARQLRYSWFGELLENEHYDYLLTAHHADDNLETFLINLSRGTGLEGLTGIPQQNGNVIRPLLIFSRSEIEEFASKHHIPWREDSSNASDKYLRNKIRHNIVPELKALNADFLQTFNQTLLHLKQAESMVDDASALVYRQVVIEKEEKLIFKIYDLKRLPDYRAYLYHWLKDFGFTAWQDIYDLVDAQSGKFVFSANFRLLKDREILILEPLKDDEISVYEVASDVNGISEPLRLIFATVTSSEIKNTSETIFVDRQKLAFPLKIRKREEGDWIYPAGMEGKKKLSKFFKDEKYSLPQKENQWLLCSGGNIVWVIGKRADRRFLADESTTDILKITLSE